MNELPQWASVWLRVTVIDTDAWTTEGAPMTTFETPCGETFRVFSEGLEIVPVSPVRADGVPCRFCGGPVSDFYAFGVESAKWRRCDNCGKTQEVLVVPVRADREAVAKAAFRGYWDSCERTKGFTWNQAEEHHIWFAVADAVLAALQATPEPERTE